MFEKYTGLDFADTKNVRALDRGLEQILHTGRFGNFVRKNVFIIKVSHLLYFLRATSIFVFLFRDE